MTKTRANTIQRMTTTTLTRTWSSWSSSKRKCSSNKCSTCRISLLARREVIRVRDKIKYIMSSNMMTWTQNFAKQLRSSAWTRKASEHCSSKCMNSKQLKKQAWKATMAKRKVTKESNWLKCSTMLKELQLEKCKSKMKKTSMKMRKRGLKSNKFSEVAKT